MFSPYLSNLFWCHLSLSHLVSLPETFSPSISRLISFHSLCPYLSIICHVHTVKYSILLLSIKVSFAAIVLFHTATTSNYFIYVFLYLCFLGLQYYRVSSLTLSCPWLFPQVASTVGELCNFFI